MLIENDFLKEFYIRWNKIKSLSGIIILEGLIENSTLRVFDISNNLLH